MKTVNNIPVSKPRKPEPFATPIIKPIKPPTNPIDKRVNTILFWKKLKKRDGNSRRSSDGMPEVVTMSYDLFVKLMNK